jgi:hypothetical protein
MNDIEVYIIVLVIVLLIAYLLTRNQSNVNSGTNPYEPGDERPRYDAPDIEGQGSFGRNRSGGFDNDAQPRTRNDSPNIRGQGSFGKDKR